MKEIEVKFRTITRSHYTQSLGSNLKNETKAKVSSQLYRYKYRTQVCSLKLSLCKRSGRQRLKYGTFRGQKQEETPEDRELEVQHCRSEGGRKFQNEAGSQRL